VREIYGVEEVRERHRHRYEVNNVLRYKLLQRGIRFAGMNIASDLVEIIELPEHRWFVGVQFHPEYKSSVGRPHPLFKSFVEAAVAYAREKDMVQKPRPPRREKVLELASAKV
jgi:CTP synthase